MNQTDWAIRQHIFETLLTEGKCTNLQIGSDYTDASYIDFSASIRFEYKDQLIHIAVKNCEVSAIANDGPMSFMMLVVEQEVDPAEPDFSDVDRVIARIFGEIEQYIVEKNTMPWYND